MYNKHQTNLSIFIQINFRQLLRIRHDIRFCLSFIPVYMCVSKTIISCNNLNKSVKSSSTVPVVDGTCDLVSQKNRTPVFIAFLELQKGS